MKKSFQLILFLFLLNSCNKDKDAFLAPHFDEANWSKIVIKGEKEATAVYGSLDSTLFVSTINKVYFTNDGGNTWGVSFNRFGPIYDFLAKSDTLYAFSARNWNIEGGLSTASICQFFSKDKGNNWQTNQNSYQSKLTKPIGIIEKEKIKYILKDNYIAKENNDNSWLRRYSEVQVIENNLIKNISLPTNNFFFNIHLDYKGLLYIATSSCDLVNPDCNGNSDAVVYISKTTFPK